MAEKVKNARIEYEKSLIDVSTLFFNNILLPSKRTAYTEDYNATINAVNKKLKMSYKLSQGDINKLLGADKIKVKTTEVRGVNDISLLLT